MVRLNNWRYLHEPTQGEYLWTIIGREEYEDWLEWLEDDVRRQIK